jgi:hypothetical protein
MQKSPMQINKRREKENRNKKGRIGKELREIKWRTWNAFDNWANFLARLILYEPPGLTLKPAAFCQDSECICLVPVSEQTSINSSNANNGFRTIETVFLNIIFTNCML